MFNFNPTTGLLDINSFPSDPSTETEARQQFMTLFNQLKNYINDNEIESGSNTNGRYTKYPDGTMICTNEVTISTVQYTDKQVEGIYGPYQPEYTFPVPFIDVPVIDPCIEASGYLYIMKKTSSKTSVILRTWSPIASTQNNVKISYTAIGRWK